VILSRTEADGDAAAFVGDEVLAGGRAGSELEVCAGDGSTGGIRDDYGDGGIGLALGDGQTAEQDG
jgi:hypothetical protein